MLYNASHTFTKFIEEPSQEDLYNCPHYFGMSTEQVKKSGAPEFLLKILDQFPWTGRPNVCQIRPQDFRYGRPPIDGGFWHVDDNVRLLDNKVATAKHIDDMKLFVISFGGMCLTEFCKTPMELPNHFESGPHSTYQGFISTPFEIHTAQHNQLVEYTSKDFHQASPVFNTGKIRLMMVLFESDSIMGNVRVLPSIREQEGK